MLQGFTNIAKIPELKKRIFYTILMLGVYRIGVFVPTPGVDRVALEHFFRAQSQTLFGLFNMFSGGALEQFSVFSLGIMPYISASIILQLLTVVIPHLERLSKEGEQGRKKITQYTRYLACVISAIQGFGIALMLARPSGVGGEAPIVPNPTVGFYLITILSLASGTAFIMWLGERISERGIGNGISLIIFAGIVSHFPRSTFQTLNLMKQGEMSLFHIMFLSVAMVGIVAAIIFFERGERRIPVQYAKRVIGNKMYAGQTSHLPLKLNMSGVIPPIFASSLMIFPSTVANFAGPKWAQKIHSLTDPYGWGYNALYVLLIVFFGYFYTAIVFNPEDVAENMKKHGGYVPGIRPGTKTAEYIDQILTRLTLVGTVYLSLVCVLPLLMKTEGGVTFYFGGTSLLIVVGVALDTIAQIETHLWPRHYEGFLGPKGGRFKGRRG